jgi:hypothetical protein
MIIILECPPARPTSGGSVMALDELNSLGGLVLVGELRPSKMDAIVGARTFGICPRRGRWWTLDAVTGRSFGHVHVIYDGLLTACVPVVCSCRQQLPGPPSRRRVPAGGDHGTRAAPHMSRWRERRWPRTSFDPVQLESTSIALVCRSRGGDMRTREERAPRSWYTIQGGAYGRGR